ncbi:helix-turn-helix transcriptional regulator [Budvicia aquatica]|nr:helix-turn-helix transcriptional regulator [Budvicia aquatica]
MKEAGHTQKSLADAVGMAQSSVWRLLDGSQGSRKTVAIAKELGVRAEWLAEGVGEMRDAGAFKSNNPESAIRNSSLRIKEIDDDETPNPDEFVEIPLLDVSLSAGNGSYELTEYSDYSLVFRRYYLRKLGVSEKNAKLVRVTGRSMEPTLHDGDIVGVNTQETTIRDGKTYAIRQGDLLRVKILIEHPDHVIIRSINREEYEDENMPRDIFYNDVHIIGQVFWSSHSW